MLEQDKTGLDMTAQDIGQLKPRQSRREQGLGRGHSMASDYNLTNFNLSLKSTNWGVCTVCLGVCVSGCVWGCVCVSRGLPVSLINSTSMSVNIHDDQDNLLLWQFTWKRCRHLSSVKKGAKDRPSPSMPLYPSPLWKKNNYINKTKAYPKNFDSSATRAHRRHRAMPQLALWTQILVGKTVTRAL